MAPLAARRESSITIRELTPGYMTSGLLHAPGNSDAPALEEPRANLLDRTRNDSPLSSVVTCPAGAIPNRPSGKNTARTATSGSAAFAKPTRRAPDHGRRLPPIFALTLARVDGAGLPKEIQRLLAHIPNVCFSGPPPIAANQPASDCLRRARRRERQ